MVWLENTHFSWRKRGTSNADNGLYMLPYKWFKLLGADFLAFVFTDLITLWGENSEKSSINWTEPHYSSKRTVAGRSRAHTKNAFSYKTPNRKCGVLRLLIDIEWKSAAVMFLLDVGVRILISVACTRYQIIFDTMHTNMGAGNCAKKKSLNKNFSIGLRTQQLS